MENINEQQIRKQAREILDKFAKSLKKVKFKEKKFKKPISGFRDEFSADPPDTEFRSLMFKNAPNKDTNFIIAEKKKW